MKTRDLLKDETIVGNPKKHLTVLAVVLFAFWMLLSGKLDLKFMTYGVLTAIVSAYICVPLLLMPKYPELSALTLLTFKVLPELTVNEPATSKLQAEISKSLVRIISPVYLMVVPFIVKLAVLNPAVVIAV